MQKNLEKIMPWREACQKAGIDGKSVIAVLLYGSQNYNLHTENSDFDFKVIILPDINDALLGEPFFIKEVDVSTGSKAVIHDIRHYVLKGLMKQNINFLETLFTEYAIYPNKYLKDLFEQYFLNKREAISESNFVQFAISICGQSYHTSHYKNGKALGKIIYFYEVLKRINLKTKNDSYLTCIWLSNEKDSDLKNTILYFKEKNFWSDSIVNLYLKNIDEEVGKIKAKYPNESTFDFKKNLMHFLKAAYKF